MVKKATWLKWVFQTLMHCKNNEESIFCLYNLTLTTSFHSKPDISSHRLYCEAQPNCQRTSSHQPSLERWQTIPGDKTNHHGYTSKHSLLWVVTDRYRTKCSAQIRSEIIHWTRWKCESFHTVSICLCCIHYNPQKTYALAPGSF